MDLLILGGTRFVGRHLVASALARGNAVTLFHRGRSNPGLFPEVEEILGDRDGDLGKLGSRRWDAVIDTCGYHPRIVRQSASALRKSVELYCFISTISVYADQTEPVDENGSLVSFDRDPESEEITAASYGPFKVECEAAVIQEMGGDRTLHIRPGLIVGPHDTTDRFTYWIDRFMSSGPVLVPDRSQQPIQFVDARDLAEFTIRQVEERSTGIFNVTGPAHALNMGEVWSVLKQNCGGLPTEVVARDAFLSEHGVEEWKDLPFVVPPGKPLTLCDITKAIDCGLTLRRIAETVSDTAAWHRERGAPEPTAGMTRERERTLLVELGALEPAGR